MVIVAALLGLAVGVAVAAAIVFLLRRKPKIAAAAGGVVFLVVGAVSAVLLVYQTAHAELSERLKGHPIAIEMLSPMDEGFFGYTLERVVRAWEEEGPYGAELIVIAAAAQRARPEVAAAIRSAPREALVELAWARIALLRYRAGQGDAACATGDTWVSPGRKPLLWAVNRFLASAQERLVVRARGLPLQPADPNAGARFQAEAVPAVNETPVESIARLFADRTPAEVEAIVQCMVIARVFERLATLAEADDVAATEALRAALPPGGAA